MVYIKNRGSYVWNPCEFLLIFSTKYHTWPIMISSRIHIFEFICLLHAPHLCHENVCSLELSIKSQDQTLDVLAKW